MRMVITQYFDDVRDAARRIYENAISSHQSPGDVSISRAGYAELLDNYSTVFTFEMGTFGSSRVVVRFTPVDWLTDGWIAVSIYD